jgi:hypothetical protein
LGLEPRFFTAILALTFFSAAPSMPRTIEYPNDQCVREPVPATDQISCLDLTTPGEPREYRLLFGLDQRPLLDITRSAKLVRSTDSRQFALNDYRGSNFTDCLIFRDAQTTQGQSAASLWEKEMMKWPANLRREVMDEDHIYYTCASWAGNIVHVVAHWQKPGGQHLNATASITPDGELVQISYRPNLPQN